MIPLRYNLRSLGRRRLRTGMTVAGVAMVVAIYSLMTSVAETMTRSFRSTGAADELVITQTSALTVEFSNIVRGSLTFLQTLEGVAVRDDRPLVSPELCLGCVITAGGRKTDATVRGVTRIAPHVYGQADLFAGEWPASGFQATLGRAAAAKLGLKVGDRLEFEGEQWTVAGLIDSGGRVYDQEIWVELDDLAAAANRTTFSSYTLRAVNARAAAGLVEEINESRRFPLSAQRADAFYERAGGMSIFMAKTGTFIATIIALAAALGGMNTMYAAVAGRRREIGVIRALGYGRLAVLTSFLLESMAICLGGALLGLLLGLLLSRLPYDLPYLAGGGVTIRTPQIVASILLALLVGVLGGVLPALHAARIKVVDALRLR